jgi:hypothetical protein
MVWLPANKRFLPLCIYKEYHVDDKVIFTGVLRIDVTKSKMQILCLIRMLRNSEEWNWML